MFRRSKLGLLLCLAAVAVFTGLPPRGDASRVRQGERDPARNEALTREQILELLVRNSATVEKFDGQGHLTGVGLAFATSNQHLVTAYQNIDGAAEVKITYPGGRSEMISSVLGFDRWQDWAVLKTSTVLPAGISFARTPPMQGELVYYLYKPESELPRCLESTIEEILSLQKAGKRWRLYDETIYRTHGSALVNRFGQLIGVVGGNTVPGNYPRPSSDDYRPPQAKVNHALATPLTAIAFPEKEQTFRQLLLQGDSIPPVKEPRFVTGGTLAGVAGKGEVFHLPFDLRNRFSRTEAAIHAVIYWKAPVKLQGELVFKVFDLETAEVAASNPAKFKILPTTQATSRFTFSPKSLPPGVYRIEVLVNGEPYWREFFQLTE